MTLTPPEIPLAGLRRCAGVDISRAASFNQMDRISDLPDEDQWASETGDAADIRESTLSAHASFLIKGMSHREEHVRNISVNLLVQLRDKFPQILWNSSCVVALLFSMNNDSSSSLVNDPACAAAIRSLYQRVVREWIICHFHMLHAHPRVCFSATQLVLRAHKDAVNSLSGSGSSQLGTVATVVAAANSTALEATKEIEAAMKISLRNALGSVLNKSLSTVWWT